MQVLIKELIECLDQEIDAYRHILNLISQEKELLVQNREEDLERLLLDLDEQVKKARYLETDRVKITKRMGVANEGTTWFASEKQMEAFAGKEMAAQITERIEKIKGLVLKISEINNNNVFLINQGRKNIKAFFDLILKQHDSRTYTNNGKIGSKFQKNILLDKRL